MKAKTTVDIRDHSGDTYLYVPAGTIIDVMEDGDSWMGWHDGISFPIDDDEFDPTDLPRLLTSPFTAEQLRAAGDQADAIQLDPLD
jgi:hypothetical protein